MIGGIKKKQIVFLNHKHLIEVVYTFLISEKIEDVVIKYDDFLGIESYIKKATCYRSLFI